MTGTLISSTRGRPVVGASVEAAINANPGFVLLTKGNWSGLSVNAALGVDVIGFPSLSVPITSGFAIVVLPRGLNSVGAVLIDEKLGFPVY